MMKRFLSILSFLLLAMLPAQAQQTSTKMKVYSEGKVVYSATVESVDSVTFQTSQKAPVADLLDVHFNADGSAEDISPMKNTVVKYGNPSTIWSNTYQRYVARFTNPWGSTASSFYKVDYTNNTQFRNALADGHTLEVLYMGDYAGTLANVEAKPFSSMQAGGTGFLITTTSGSRKNEMTFLPNVSTTGSSTWRWCTSGIVPQARRFYHLVGVWDKSKGKAYVYVDGELRNTITASGSLVFPSSGCTWFCIGGDPGSAEGAQAGWTGDIVLARVYDKPLGAEEVSALWDEYADLQAQAEPDMVTDVNYLSGMPVKAGGYYAVSGTGFAQGDKIRLVPTAEGASEQTVNVELIEETGIRFQLPANLASGMYRMILVRGDKVQDLGLTTFNIVATMPHGCKVIAHRGYWDTAGACRNSRRSLQNALDLNVYGSETDVWLTADGVMMVNHDATFSGVRLETSTAEQCKALTLSNGEKMPTLEEFLVMMQSYEGPTKLIIEVKTHSDPARGQAAADSTVSMVKRLGVEDKVEYIAFSLDICKRLAQIDPEAKVAYLNGGMSPAQLHQFGITGLDYTAANYRNNPSWVTSARSLGMTTNVWTINSEAEIIEMNNMDIDYITTDNPVAAARILKYYEDAQ